MKRILPIIVVAQFCCTSLWFAGNAVIADIIKAHHLSPSFLAHLTSAVQFGFITGTLVFAILTIADRFSPSLVFLISSLIASTFNLGMLIDMPAASLLVFRFATGFFLAGIYPVGMKIASDYYQKTLGKSLGFLVGALVLGTAFPHLLKSLTASLPWEYVVVTTSAFSIAGGLMLWLTVPDGPHRTPGQGFKPTALFTAFRDASFRSIVLGYMGHMWELYAFWAFVPVMLTVYNQHGRGVAINVPLMSFLIIASGSVACVIGGVLSRHFGVKRIATIALFLSCCCCLLSPLFLFGSSVIALLTFLLFWGMVVIADSPLFSTLVAHNAPATSRGTSLTFVNCIGFSITILSIQVINLLSGVVVPQYLYMFLAIGPVLGLFALLTKQK
jgi:MFS family permease